MKAGAALAVMLLALPALAASAELPAEGFPPVGERVFVLLMENTRFNLRSWPDTPLLEAYAGENMRFVVHVPATAEPHTFHLHGHPWVDPATGVFIDAILLMPGETHEFQVRAGLGDGFAGDWFYHCHVEQHFGEGMWGILRVYPYGLTVTGGPDSLRVRAWSADGGAVTVDRVTVTLDGAPVDARVTRAADGAFDVAPRLGAFATGEFVVTTHAAEGESVARFTLDATGTLTQKRHVRPPADALTEATPAFTGPLTPTLTETARGGRT